MLSWLRAKKDLEHILKYQVDLQLLWQIEAAASKALNGSSFWSIPSEYQRAVQRKASGVPEYQKVRDRVARATPRMKRIAYQANLGTEFISCPPPAVGGPVIRVNAFDAVLTDCSHGGIPQQSIIDLLNQTRGTAEDNIHAELIKSINPFHWLKELIVLILRIPFVLVQATGFNVEKVEDHLLSKIFKFAELVFIIWLGFKIGLGSDDLHSLFERIVMK